MDTLVWIIRQVIGFISGYLLMQMTFEGPKFIYLRRGHANDS